MTPSLTIALAYIRPPGSWMLGKFTSPYLKFFGPRGPRSCDFSDLSVSHLPSLWGGHKLQCALRPTFLERNDHGNGFSFLHNTRKRKSDEIRIDSWSRFCAVTFAVQWERVALPGFNNSSVIYVARRASAPSRQQGAAQLLGKLSFFMPSVQG